MSDFSDVDRSAGPDRLVRYLDATDAGLAASKSYLAAAAARAIAAGDLVLDLGCGVGHDLARLEALGRPALGVDSSLVMLGHARTRAQTQRRLVQADGLRLPIRSGSLGGCRIERVLQHVDDPKAVVAEVRRVLRDGGWFGVYEPDHAGMHITSDHGDRFLAGLLRVRHPTIGADLVALLEHQGFRIDDVVTEASIGHAFDHLPVDATAVVRRAVADGRVDAGVAETWLEEQHRRTTDGTFRSTWVKVLVVAHALAS